MTKEEKNIINNKTGIALMYLFHEAINEFVKKDLFHDKVKYLTLNSSGELAAHTSKPIHDRGYWSSNGIQYPIGNFKLKITDWTEEETEFLELDTAKFIVELF